jgi:hypothetical protein
MTHYHRTGSAVMTRVKRPAPVGDSRILATVAAGRRFACRQETYQTSSA